MFTYNRHVKQNLQSLNVSKYPTKILGNFIIKTPKTNIIIPLRTSYYMQQNPQNMIRKILLKYYNQFISSRNQALIWLQTTIDTGKKLKYGTKVKKIYHKLLDFITIEIIKV